MNPHYPPESLSRTAPFPPLHPRSTTRTYDELGESIFPADESDADRIERLRAQGHDMRIAGDGDEQIWQWVQRVKSLAAAPDATQADDGRS